MRCSKAVQQLQLYIDQQLSLQQLRALESHLSTCEACLQEYRLLEEVTSTLHAIAPIVEPANLTSNIMRRVAMSELGKEEQMYRPWRPSSAEMLLVLLLATVATLFLIIAQPKLRDSLPVANGLATLSLLLSNMLHLFVSLGSFGLWVVGTLLGVCITLMVAGNEMRSLWFKAMMERLPVW